MLNKLLNVVSLTFLVLLYFPSACNAYEGVFDDFDSADTNLWTYNARDGSILFEDGVVKFVGPGYGLSPFAYSKFDGILEDGTAVEYRIRPDKISGHGSGLSIGFTGNTDYPFYEFSLWLDSNNLGPKFDYNNFSAPKYDCSIFVPGNDQVDRETIGVNLADDWNIVRITRSSDTFSLYINNMDIGSSVSSYTGNDCGPENVIIGNPLEFYGYYWSNFSLDYYRQFSLDEEEKSKKVIILPGLGASWNGEAMVYGSEVDDSSWKMTPFVKNYDSLKDYLEGESISYEVWNYDWRRPLSEIVESFSNYYSSVASSDEDVYLVGHSLGGLVARLWYQGLEEDGNLAGVITVGSPHLGSIKAYEAYNGGKLSDDSFGVDDIAWNLYLTLNSKGGSTRVETIRSLAPILKDLSPTYEFLRKDGAVYLTANSVYFNDYLSSWNNDHLGWDKVRRFVGVGEETKESISLGSRSIYQEALGVWPDGSVIGYSLGDGDGTVIKSSASGVGEGGVEVTGGHGELVDKSLLGIADILGTNSPDSLASTGNYTGSLFYLGSPAKLKLVCDNFEIEDDLGFIYTEEETNGCDLKVLGESEGIYHLVVADLEENDWKYFESKTKDGQVDTYKLGSDVGNVDAWYGLLSYYVDRLEEKDSKSSFVSVRRMIKKKDINSIMSWVLRYRRIREEDVYTRLMIGAVEKIYSKDRRFARVSWNSRILSYLEKHLTYVEKINQFLLLRGKKPSVFSASSYEWSKEILERLEEKEWSPLQKYYWSRVLLSLFSEARSS